MKSNRATQEPRWVRYGLLAVGLGFLFFFLGLPLVAVFVVVIQRRFILDEEARLSRRFGEDYLDYTARVRRWL